MGSLAGFHSGRDTESPIPMNYSRPWNCFVLSSASLSVPESQSFVPRPDWAINGKYINIFKKKKEKKRIMSLMYGKHSQRCLATDLESNCKVKGQKPAQESLHHGAPHSASLSAYLQYFLSALQCSASDSVIFPRFPITV